MITPGTFADDAGRYRLDSLIAVGGMGEVWRASDTLLSREVAIKVLKPEYAGDPVFRSRFEAEGRHAASLHHPGIASVFDVGESIAPDGSPRPYLVMELVEGQPLSALLRPGETMEPDVVRDLLAQAGDALGAAHDAGIVHRDVKPANLIVTPERDVKVTDFGISRARAAASITGTGAVMGTPQYLSPEQARGETASPASDVYGLGVVAYECLMGRRPFDKETAVATALAHLNDPVPTLPGLDPQLAAIVRRALAKNPRERYQDGHQFASALRMTGETSYVPPVIEQEPVPTQVIAAAPAPPPEPERSLLPVWLLLILGALVIVVAALFWLLHSNGSPAPSGPSDSSSSTTASVTPTITPSAGASPVVLDEASYKGEPVATAVQQLTALGLVPTTQEVPNPGGDTPNTVAALSPTSGLKQGDPIQVAYYGADSSATPTTSSSPTRSSTPTPTRSSTPTPTPPSSATATETPTASTSPAAPATTPASSITTDTPTTSAAAAAAPARKDTP